MFVLVGGLAVLVLAVVIGTVALRGPASSCTAVLGGGPQSLEINLQLQPVNGKSPDSGALEITRQILLNRLSGACVAGAAVRTQAPDLVVIDLPGLPEADRIRSLLVTTGKLVFVPLPVSEYGTSTAPGTQTPVSGQPLPTTETPLFGGEEISEAYATTDSTGLPAVGFRLKDKGSQLFADYTSKSVGQFFAIVLDDEVVSAPYVQSPITGGTGLISGGSNGFSAGAVNNLVVILNYGSLPFPVHEVSVQPVGTSNRATAAP